MNRNSNLTVVISVDMKKRRIRVHKRMLHLLGDPKYIQLLVNPANKSVAIRGVKSSIPGDQAEKIKPQSMLADNSYELYSKTFIEKLCAVVGGLEFNTYRLSGTIVAAYNMAVFSLNTLTKVEV